MIFENEKEQKEKFAVLLLKNPNNAYDVACRLYPNDVSRSMFIFNHWQSDPYVEECQDKLLEEFGEEHFLPTKAELAREIWDRAKAAYDDDSFTKLMRLYADVLGYIKKSDVNIDNRQMLVSPKIMILPAIEQASEDVWENCLKEQQRSLTLDPASRS